MNREPCAPWLSLHVFLADPVASEGYLRECLAPAIAQWRADGWLERWFFIRYWEGGPHLRIRLAGPIALEGEAAKQLLAARIDEFRAVQPPAREAYYRDHAFDGAAVALDDLPWYGEGAIVDIAYQPETTRYGGIHAIDASEALFELSSQLALAVCKATGGNQGARLSAAFGLMAAAVLACGEDVEQLGIYFERYAAGWAARVGASVGIAAAAPGDDQSQLLARLAREAAAGWSGNSVHARWAAGVRRLADRLRELHGQGLLRTPFEGRQTGDEAMCRNALLGIVGSQIHMLNNRLGIPPAGEWYLARLVAGAAQGLSRQGATT